MKLRMEQAQVVNAILGFWLFLSAFLWKHHSGELNNAWIVGILTVAAAVATTTIPWMRYLVALLGAWLFVAAWMIPHALVATAWNNAIVAVLMVAFSLFPGQGVAIRKPREA